MFASSAGPPFHWTGMLRIQRKLTRRNHVQNERTRPRKHDRRQVRLHACRSLPNSSMHVPAAAETKALTMSLKFPILPDLPPHPTVRSTTCPKAVLAHGLHLSHPGWDGRRPQDRWTRADDPSVSAISVHPPPALADSPSEAPLTQSPGCRYD